MTALAPRTRVSRGFGIGVVLALVCFGSPHRLATAADKQSDGVDPFYGAFGTEVPIELPGFHGLEPTVKLSYSSSGRDGFVGVGWVLAAGSTIERDSPGKGSPKYDASDIFLLDGQELVPNTALGGTHATKIQNYHRITRDNGANRWYVWRKDGTKATYTALFGTSLGTFRWGLKTLVDTRGNTVTFNYWCDPGAECYLDNIAYNGTSVKFYREGRPDELTYATGAGLARTRYRLKTVDVTVNGSRARTYRLSYTTSAASGRSLLASVQQYGRNATVDASGNVTGGSALPPLTLGQDSVAMSYQSGASPAGGGYFSITSGATIYSDGGMRMADVNGDGRQDILWALWECDGNYGAGCEAHRQTWLSTGTGWVAGAAPPGGGYFAITTGDGTYSDGGLRVADVNGDGKDDLVWALWECDGNYGAGCQAHRETWLSTGTGWTAGAAPDGGGYFAITTGGSVYSDGGLRVADVNGDGKDDLVWALWECDGNYGAGCEAHRQTRLSTGTGWTAGAAPDGGGYFAITTGASVYSDGGLRVADVNGDGKSDLIWALWECDGNYGAGCEAHRQTRLSTGTGWADGPAPDGGGYFAITTGASTYSDGGLRVADMNGDGRSDLVWALWECDGNYGAGCEAHRQTRLSTGTGWTAGAAPDGGGYFAIASGDSVYSDGGLRISDVDGDGRSDLIWSLWECDGNYGTGCEGHRQTRKIHAGTDLVTSVSNGLGGTTTVGYTPSSAWNNTYLPSGMVMQTVSSVTTSDGRGHSATTSYQYQGGLWSSAERRFLGFRKVTGVIDAAGNYTETYYHQHVGCISKPEVTYYRSATGSIFSYSTYEYQESASAPYTSLLTDRWDYQCEGGGNCQRVLVQLGYDVYGNVIEAREYGNYDAAGDERTTISGFYPNTTKYIVGKKGYENVYQGIGTAGRLMKREVRYFDGQTAYTSPAQVGNMTMRKRWNDQTGGYVTETFGYDGWGNVTRQTDGLGYDKTTAYDSTYHVYPTQECDALGYCRNQGYDTVLGKVTSETDTNGNTATRSYDVFGRPVRLTRPGGSWVERQYLSWGSPSAQKVRTVTSDGTSDGLWEDAYFDGMQREYMRVRDGGATQLTEYFEGTARVWKQSLWYAPASESARYVVRSYDGSGRVVRVTAPDGTHADTSYAICYNPADGDFAAPRACTTRTDELGHAAREAVDGFGQVVNRSEWNGTEARTHYSYDVLGREIQVEDAVGNIRSQSWDSLGNLLSVCDPDLGCWSYGYDAAGRRIRATDAKGQVTTMSYDGIGRRVSETAADGSVVSYTYDESGHGEAIGTEPTSVTWSGGSDSRSYDAAGRVTSATRCVLGQCETVGWSYDSAGRLASISYPGETVSYGYDSAGNISSVSGYATALVHDARGQLTRIDFANGTSQSYSYDANRTWLASSAVTRSGATLYQASYGYDAAARVTQLSSSTDSRLNLSLSYDALNRLTGVSGGQSESYGYDALGRITSKSDVGSFGYGAAHDHAVTSAGGQSYSYDQNGSMTGGAGRTLEWDAKNRLASVTKDGLTTSFGYDPNGQRTYRTVGGETTRYFGKLVERSASGQLQTYVYAGAMLLAKKAAAAKLYYHTDHLGSVQLMTDAAGSVVKSYDYAPFGKSLQASGSAADARRFGGHDYDSETGLIYMNARYYDPLLGRFVSADTLIPDPSKPQALDRYAYAYNNPISNLDPSGHAPVVVAVVAAAAVVSTTTSVVIAAVAIAGAVCTVAGYVLKDPTLMTIGGVLLGFATGYMGPLLGGGLAGGLLGAAVAAATSPLSPLDPGLKQAIGWAYAAACFTASQIKASETLENLDAGARQQAANEGLTVDQVREMGFKDPNRAMMSAHLISKDAVGYTMKDALNAAIKDNNLGLGMVGPGSGSLTTILDSTVGRIPSVQLHGIVHDAYGLAFTTWGVGPGYGYSGKLAPFMSSGSPLTGQATGIFRNTFLTPVTMGELDAISGSLGHQLESLSWGWANV